MWRYNHHDHFNVVHNHGGHDINEHNDGTADGEHEPGDHDIDGEQYSPDYIIVRRDKFLELATRAIEFHTIVKRDAINGPRVYGAAGALYVSAIGLIDTSALGDVKSVVPLAGCDAAGNRG